MQKSKKNIVAEMQINKWNEFDDMTCEIKNMQFLLLERFIKFPRYFIM